jgi:hypothetical protein
MNAFDELTANQALRALTTSSDLRGGVRVVSGTVGDLPVPWLLSAAHDMVRLGGHDILWDAERGELALCDPVSGDVAYRFVTADPFVLPEPGPHPDTDRPALRLVGDAS